jgi:hypothetical protein
LTCWHRTLVALRAPTAVQVVQETMVSQGAAPASRKRRGRREGSAG